MGLFGNNNNNNSKMEKVGSLNVFYGKNLIFVEVAEKNKEELFEFCDAKFNEGFHLKSFNGVGNMVAFANYLFILEKKG